MRRRGAGLAADRRGSRRGASLRDRVRKLANNECAAATVEFSLVAIPLLGLILGALQLSLTFFAGQILQSAATDAGRQLMTGQAQSGGMTAAQFGQLVCSPISGLFNCNNMMVDVQSAGAYSAINTAPPTLTFDSKGKVANKWAWSPGGAGAVVIVRVMYDWPVFGPGGLGLANEPDGGHLLIAATVLKNEPFPS